jgi:sigma-E factor negative regulatory protein RseA
MKIERTKEISALFDGELEEHEVRAAIQASLNDADSWRLYGLIGDGLRGEPVDVPDMTASVMSRIGEEPVVLAPRNLKTRQRHHPLLALAASVAGVAVVGWVALTGNPQSPAAEQNLAAAQKGKVDIAGAVSPAPTFVNLPQAGMQGDMNEYLLAHHAQAATARLGDSTKQIRTVAMSSARP